MSIDTGGPAMPSHGSMGEVTHEGMTLRDYFAAHAMQSILYETIKIEGDATTHRVARDAYRVADAMLRARTNTPDESVA